MVFYAPPAVSELLSRKKPLSNISHMFVLFRCRLWRVAFKDDYWDLVNFTIYHYADLVFVIKFGNYLSLA